MLFQNEHVCPSAIVQIEYLYCLVTGGSKPPEKPPSFICNKSFTDTIFILKGVHHLPLLSFPLSSSAYVLLPSSFHSTYASFQSFTTFSLFSSHIRRVRATPFLHSPVPHTFSFFLDCLLHCTFPPSFCIPLFFLILTSMSWILSHGQQDLCESSYAVSAE